jgi:hypothetical protein
VQTRQSAAATRDARCGICGRASLEAANDNHLIPRPDSDVEGAGAAAQDRVGATIEWLKGWNQAAPMDPDEGGGEQLVGQVGARIAPRQRRGRNMQGFGKFFDNGVELNKKGEADKAAENWLGLPIRPFEKGTRRA